VILTDDQILEIAQNPVNSTLIKKGVELQDEHKVHITGEGYQDYIKQILSYEDHKQYAQKKELAEPVTTVLTRRIINEHERWKDNSGPQQYFEFSGKRQRDKEMIDVLSQVWKGESMDYFIDNFVSEALYTEFNGFLIVEQGRIIKEDRVLYEIRDGVKSIVKDDKIRPYIIFRSIDTIHDFQSKGNRVEYIIMEWGEEEREGKKIRLYRAIDDSRDRILERDGGEWIISKKYPPIYNKVGRVNAVQISTNKLDPTVDEIKTSYIWQVIPLLKTYLTNWAEHVITSILHSHPIYYQLGQKCRYQNEHGQCDNGYITWTDEEGKYHEDVCPACHGVGAVLKKDASAMIILPQTDETGQPYNIQNVAGYVTPPVEALENQRKELDSLAEQIYQSGTGMSKLMEVAIEKTATEAILNYKPLEKIIGDILSNIEYIRTTLTDMIGKLYFGASYKRSSIIYTRQLNLRDENTILMEIEQAKRSGASISFVRTLHEELIRSRYQNSPLDLERNIILSQLEPFIGYTPEELQRYFADYVEKSSLIMKVYFTDYVAQFENEYGPITDYKADKPLDERVKSIGRVLNRYNKAKTKALSAKVSDGNLED